MAALVAASLAVGIVTARLRQSPETGTASWDAARAAGFAGYLLLWLSVVTGLAVRLRVRVPRGPATWMLETHRITSALGLAFVAGHVFALLLDPVVPFSPVDALVPFTSGYRPWQTGVGTPALWLLVIVMASTALPAVISYGRWRQLHYLAFPCWGLALLHGITSGTDSGATLAVAIYAGSAAAVAALVCVRMFGRGWVSAEPVAPVRLQRYRLRGEQDFHRGPGSACSVLRPISRKKASLAGSRPRNARTMAAPSSLPPFSSTISR